MSARKVGDVLNPRRTNQPVRAGSFDVNDRRAQVFEAVWGAPSNFWNWRNKFLKVVREYDKEKGKAKGKRHTLGVHARDVLETLLDMVNPKTAQLDPCLKTLMQKTGFAKATVVEALKRLRQCGFIDWVRRTEKTGNPPGDGPQVKQASNAYFFNLSDLARVERHAKLTPSEG